MGETVGLDFKSLKRYFGPGLQKKTPVFYLSTCYSLLENFGNNI